MRKRTRSDAEMTDLILKFAEEDDRIRAVLLSGSRTNSLVKRDPFQDYDVVYVVTSMEDFINDRAWIQHFGELIVMQTPDENVLIPSTNRSFAFLMLFQDGNRIDLTFYPADALDSFKPESLSVVLLDKDGIIGPLSSPSNQDYITPPPTEQQFFNCCNEFWWVSPYVAKGLWRKELPYAKFMLERPVRDAMTLMLRWHIGIQTDFSVHSGNFGKYFEKYLDTSMWETYVQTFPDADYENIWDALFRLGDLFREVATGVACHFGYPYPLQDDERVSAYLLHVRNLPHSAKAIFE